MAAGKDKLHVALLSYRGNMYCGGQGVYLVIIYASLGAVFFPFLAATLLYLLNSRRVVPEYRNRLFTNTVLAASILLFVAVGVQELLDAIGGG